MLPFALHDLNQREPPCVVFALQGLYKQATVGDNTTSQPWAVQMTERAKWDAWTANKGKSQDDAKKAYVALVEGLVAAQ